MATYTYRNGAVPTVVDTETEITRELGTAAANRVPGNAGSSIKELSAALGVNVDTSADDYTFVATLQGTGVAGARQEFPLAGYGTQTATIASVATGYPIAARGVDASFSGKGDIAMSWVQHGDTIALGFGAIGIAYV